MKLGSMQEEENSQWVLWTLLLQISSSSSLAILRCCDMTWFFFSFFLGFFLLISLLFSYLGLMCRCPICLLEYEESDVLRQLPACGHIFHTSCVDPWLEKQPTCPVCRVLLLLLQSTKASEEPEPSSSEHEHQERSRPSSRASAPQLAAFSTPSWVLVNPPLPLPPAAAIPFPPTATAVDSSSSSSSTKASSSSSSSLSSSRTHDLEAGHFPQASNLSKDSAPGECPQLRDSKTSANSRTSCHQLETVDGWGSGYLKSRLVSDCRSCKSLQDVARNIMSSNNAASSSSSSSSASCNIQIKSRGMKNHSVHSRRWLTESFSFVLSDTFGTEDKNPSSLQEPAATTVDQFSNKSATTTTNHQSFYYSSYNRQHSESLRVYESRLNADSQLPLTISPEKCSFEFVPVLTGGCSAMDFSCRWRTNNKQTNKHTTFSCSSLSSGNRATCS
jgi:hypothetical protein